MGDGRQAQPVHLDRVLNWEPLDDRLDGSFDDQLRDLLLADSVRHEVERFAAPAAQSYLRLDVRVSF
jgi:hypothetical protein